MRMFNEDNEDAIALFRENVGAEIMTLIEDESIENIFLNPNGSVFIMRYGETEDTGYQIRPHETEKTIKIIASITNVVCDAAHPILSAKLPVYGHRIEGVIPPASPAAHLSIRRHVAKEKTLDSYIEDNTMTPEQVEYVRQALAQRKSIIIAGETGSGKTTLMMALLNEIASSNERLAIIEDTPELRFSAKNFVHYYTSELEKYGIDSTRSVKSTLRATPKRIIFGEVRGREAEALLDSWNSGHSGMASFHAKTTKETLLRFEGLLERAGSAEPKPLIGQAVDVVICISAMGTHRTVHEICEVDWEDGKYSIRQVFWEKFRKQRRNRLMRTKEGLG